MKTNIITINTIMTKATKVICAVVMLLGMSVNAWGATTGTIEFGNNGTKINTASVSGDDDLGNTWTITTVGTTSYTQSTSYSQVGSGDHPATSITFTMTLPSSKNITEFSAKFGGFSSTAGTVTLKVGDTSVGTGSLSGVSDVTISNSSTASGTVLQVTVTSISRGVKCYYISYTYSNTAKYTVTYNAEGGTCGTASETESTIDGGVILPAATANAASYGWGFYGWATSSESSVTTTAPTIVGKAGDRYYPSANITLHAVYAKGEYTKVTSTSEITSGSKYLIAGWYDSKVHVMTSTYVYTDDYYMKEKVITESSVGKISAASIIDTWRYIITGTPGSYFIQNVITNKYIDTYYTDWYEHNYDSDDSYTIAFSDGQCSIKNNYASCSFPYLVLFAEGDFGTVDEEWAGMLLYKETKTPKYCSNPSTVRLVASPAAGGSVVFDENSSAEMDFATEEGYIGDITATPNSGYDFLNWVSSISGSEIEIDPTNGAEAAISAETSATITAYFYQNHSVTYNLTEGGVVGEGGNPTTITKSEMNGFSSGFTMQAHYKNMTLSSVTMGGSPLTKGAEADYEWELDDNFAMLTIHHDNIDGDIVITVSATPMEYTKYAFSCAELTLTPILVTANTPIFITSAAGKTVRSQDKIEISGNGLTPSTTLTFPGLPSQFAIKKADGTALATDGSGSIEEDAYIYYTPDGEDTSDGLDKLTGISVSVGGAKPITKNLTQEIIGRHLPAIFVIAAKASNNKWYALPADMATGTPSPVEIAVDNSDNPSKAYTATTNSYALYDQASGQHIKLEMHGQDNAPLYAAGSSSGIGKSGNAIITNTLSNDYLWLFTQTNTNITYAADAKYTMKSAAGNGNQVKLWEAAGGAGVPKWGQYASGINQLRIIPLVGDWTEGEIVEWGQHKAIVEVYPYSEGNYANTVDATINGITKTGLAVTQTLTSVKNGATKYNYTVDFTTDIDFATLAGKTLLLEWKYNGTSIGACSMVVPRIIAANATMSEIESRDTYWTSQNGPSDDVHVLPGVTLTADAGSFGSSDVTIKNLEIYPGATVKITTGMLDVPNLVLRNGWTRAGVKAYDVARLYVASTATLAHTNAYSDWYIDYDQYYPVAVPFPVATSSISYKNTKSSATAGVRLRYYSGELRAAHIQENQADNWVEYTWGGTMPTNLEPSKGYIMTAKRPTGKAFSIVRMPLTFTNEWTTSGEQGVVEETHKDQVAVTAWGNENTPSYAKGWNIIANPYMSLHQGALSYTDKGTIEYANIPDINFKEYDQLPIATTKLKPSSAFLVQAPKDGTVTFDDTKRQASAPSYRQEVQAETIPTQRAYIVLASEDAEDMMGILVSDKYSAEYEINADLEKLLGDGKTLRTYMHWNDMKMAYLAINKELAQQYIPVSVRIETEGEHTFSMHSASIVGELKSVYLTDYTTGAVTNLLEDSYSFYSTAGTINGRFAINAKIGERPMPTELDIIRDGNEGTGPIKFIYHDKVFILHQGMIYDATGKKVREIKK